MVKELKKKEELDTVPVNKDSSKKEMAEFQSICLSILEYITRQELLPAACTMLVLSMMR